MTRIDLDKCSTTYSHGTGVEHHAIQLPWQLVTDLLGREHEGHGGDDQLLVAALLAVGAPAWVSDACGWTDEYGWGLIGPALELDLQWSAEADDTDQLGTIAVVHTAIHPLQDGWWLLRVEEYKAGFEPPCSVSMTRVTEYDDDTYTEAPSKVGEPAASVEDAKEALQAALQAVLGS